MNEKSHQPVGNALIALLDDSGHVAASTTSDSSLGAFYLDAPRRGSYRLRILIGRGGLSYGPFFVLDSAQTVERTFAVPDWPKAVLDAYLPDSVTKPAATQRGNRSPRFPDSMRSVGRGDVTRVAFVVDTSGHADMNTFWVIQSDDEAFTRATREYVASARFIPAERDGVRVPQIYELPIDYGFGDEPPRVKDHNTITIRALGVVRRR